MSGPGVPQRTSPRRKLTTNQRIPCPSFFCLWLNSVSTPVLHTSGFLRDECCRVLGKNTQTLRWPPGARRPCPPLPPAVEWGARAIIFQLQSTCCKHPGSWPDPEDPTRGFLGDFSESLGLSGLLL